MEIKNTFGDAIYALKNGQKVARAGWNGKGMFLYLQKECVIDISDHDCIQYPLQEFIMMKTAQDTLVPWLASQSDVLANDWQVVENYVGGVKFNG